MKNPPTNIPISTSSPMAPLAFIAVILLVSVIGLVVYVATQASKKGPSGANPDLGSNSALTGIAPIATPTGVNKATLIDNLDSPAIGPLASQAKVTVVEFLDFQCPYCKESAPIVKQLLARYQDKPVRFVFRNLPLESIHPIAVPAAHASLCAHSQQKFFSMHDILYAKQSDITSENLYLFARDIGLEMNIFSQCMSGGIYRAQIQKDLSDAIALNATGTPTWFINGQRFEGALSFETMTTIIDKMLTNR